MRGYKRIRISENKSIDQKTSDTNIVEQNIIKISIITFIIVTILLFIGFYLIIQKTKIKIGNEENKLNTINLLNNYINNSNNINGNNNNYNNIDNKNINLTEEVQKYEKTIRKITKQEINEFRRINNLNILYDRTKYKRSENPDITVVTTIRNQAHCIHKAIRSVQNQSLKNIEMIIVDDCSLDNSTETVEQYMKEDERIILLKHEDINEGIMITRNEAIRRAKGKYITVLDADDTLLHKDILNYSLTVATMANLDVVEFYTALYSNNELKGYYHFHGILPIVYQPELKNKFIIFKDQEDFRAIKCRTLWGKIVKNDIFQKALDNIPDKYLYDYILGFEDTMITVSLYQVAQSYYCLRQPGYYYTFDERRNRYPLSKNKKCKVKEGIVKGIDHIKFLQFLLDKLDDNEIGKKTIYHELKAINKYGYSNLKKTITHHFNWTYNILDELINSKYLDEKQIDKVKKIKEEVKENELKQKREKNI